MLLNLSFISFLVFIPLSANGQQYTIQDFSNDADVIISANIVSKEAFRMSVKTPQPDGSILESTAVFTKYGINIAERSGETEREIREFVLPGGQLGSKRVSWTHTPEFEVRQKIVISLQYDALNNYFIPWGIPPQGRDAGVYIVYESEHGRFLIPYRRYSFDNFRIEDLDLSKVKKNLSQTTNLIILDSSELIDFDSFWESILRVDSDE